MSESTLPLDLFEALRIENETLRARAESVARSNASAVEMLARVEGLRRQLEDANHELRCQKEQLAEALESARAANAAKSAFLAGASHELRTPLQAIIGYSELIEEAAVDQHLPEFKSDAAKIRLAGRRLLELVNDVLDLAKAESGKLSLVISTFRADSLVREVEDQIRPLAMAAGARLLTCCDAPVGRVTTDRLRMSQILTNLLSNACKFARGGQIALTVARERHQGADCIEWTVSDTGIGISPEDQIRIFDAFAQVDTSRSKKYGGTGLGLAISRKICTRMGGTLNVESVLGKGASFTARIPDPVFEPLD